MWTVTSAIDASPTYNGRTAIIVTADHGGGTSSGTGNSHTDASAFCPHVHNCYALHKTSNP